MQCMYLAFRLHEQHAVAFGRPAHGQIGGDVADVVQVRIEQFTRFFFTTCLIEDPTCVVHFLLEKDCAIRLRLHRKLAETAVPANPLSGGEDQLLAIGSPKWAAEGDDVGSWLVDAAWRTAGRVLDVNAV